MTLAVALVALGAAVFFGLWPEAWPAYADLVIAWGVGTTWGLLVMWVPRFAVENATVSQ